MTGLSLYLQTLFLRTFLFLSLPLSHGSVERVIQISIERILNALPEGILIAVFAWGLLRVLRRQNSGTRFAVWFLALLTVAVLPLLGGLGEGKAPLARGMAWGHLHPAITIPGTWALFVFVIWAFGASVAMARLAAGLWHLRRIRRSCTPIVVADLDPAVRKTVEAIGASGERATIAVSDSVRVPAAIGFWKRTIILPAWTLRELPAEDLNVILLHEFEHLRRGDDWTNLIQKIVRALFFFHPAVWWIESRLSVEREMACDDAVLAKTANPRGYASCLVSLLEKSLAHRVAQRLTDERWSMAQAAVRRAHEASLRLAQILDSNRPKATRVWKPALGMVGVFSMVCLLALPIAPQFVAFDRGLGHGLDRNMTASDVDPAYSPAVTRASLPLLPSTSGARGVGVHVRPDGRDAGRSTEALPVGARMNEGAQGGKVVAINARADQEGVPEFPTEFGTLVFVETTVETTQYVTSDSSVWSVQVWHVMLVTRVPEQLARVPVAKI